MAEADEPPRNRNLWAVSWTSFLTDIASEMVLNLLPLYFSSVLGLRANAIGLIEGVAESTASLLKLFSGWLSDRFRQRKGLAVVGYGLSALTKPFFYWATTWETVAALRWLDRVGKGVRTAPRDALLADSVRATHRGSAFGIHRAADSTGAAVGVGLALLVVLTLQGGAPVLEREVFRTLVLLSTIPAVLGVLVLIFAARDVPVPSGEAPLPPFAWRGLGRRFGIFLAIVALFDLGNSADAFLILRAAERGLNVAAILAMLLTFNLVYALSSAPAGILSDRLGRRAVLVAGWLLYAAVYFGLALAQQGSQVWALVGIYGLYSGLTFGTVRALVADLVPAELRGTAYGLLGAVLAVLDLPASVIAGVLWHGVGSWPGLGPAAPFFFGGSTALIAALLLLLTPER